MSISQEEVITYLNLHDQIAGQHHQRRHLRRYVPQFIRDGERVITSVGVADAVDLFSRRTVEDNGRGRGGQFEVEMVRADPFIGEELDESIASDKRQGADAMNDIGGAEVAALERDGQSG